MGWDGAGGYTRQHNFSADASAGVKILAARMDQEIDDFASAIQLAWARDGQNVPTADMPMGGRKFVNVGAPTSVSNFMRVREFIENVPIFMQDAESSADRISVSSQYFTSVSANQAPVDGTKIMVRVASDKSSAVLYLDGHSANVEYQDGNRIGAALVSGGIYEFTYSSSDTSWKVATPDDGRTAAEIAAGVTPTNFRYEPGNVRRYGAKGDGVTDDTTAIANAFLVANAGLGFVYAPAGTYLTGQINWPGNNLKFYGDGSGYSYNSFVTPRTTIQAKAATSIVLDLVQTGIAEDRTGNHICDLDINGDSIAAVGIDLSGANVIERCTVRGCTTAGIRGANYLNSSRIVNCGIQSNSGWGIYTSGAGNTTFSIEGSAINLNSSGGINFEGGVGVHVSRTVIESNTGPGIRIYRDNSHSGTFSTFTFDSVWIEDNASNAPYFTIVLDAGTSDSTYGPQRVTFRSCRVSTATTRKWLNANVCKYVKFIDCNFSGSTETDAITLSSNSRYVGFINSTGAVGFGGGDGISATQMDNALAQGVYCWAHDSDVKRTVGSGSPAPAFTNSWVNNGGGYADAAYYFTEDGEVVIEGSVKDGTALTSVFTLPTGYRPPTTRTFAVDSNGAYGMVTVNTDGTVVQTVGGNTILHLNGIRFRTST